MFIVPLIAAALNSVKAENDRRRQEQMAVDDTVNSIREKAAAAHGGNPYAMMEANGEVSGMRAHRAYEPPENAIGLAIQALAAEGDKPDSAPAPGAAANAAQYKLDHSFTPTQYGDPNDLIDPWKRR
jgi:hypothetical protein